MYEESRFSQRISSRGMMVLLATCLAALPMLSIGAYQLYTTRQTLAAAQYTRGTILDIVRRDNAYYPVVRLETPQGILRFTEQFGTGNLSDFPIGSMVDVVYDPFDVRSARVYSWRRMWMPSLLMLAGGIVPMAGGVAFVMLTERKRHMSSDSAEE